MNFLADENFPQKSVQLLRESNFDVKSIGLDLPGVTDEEILEYATQEERTILTFDRDYGELIFKYGYKPGKGVIYFRIFGFKPEEPAQILFKIWISHKELRLSRVKQFGKESTEKDIVQNRRTHELTN